MADDAGSLLVRAGLIADDQLGTARRAQAASGGTVSEHLVLGGFISDEDLTQFYSEKLLVPRVNHESLQNISPRLLKLIPADMAAEFRVVPVAIDREQNLTLAMSDPSHAYAADEIGFFTGTSVIRAVALQTEIAWCLSHYYGHITPIGETLVGAELPDDDDGHDEFEVDRTPVITPQVKRAESAIARKIDSIKQEFSGPHNRKGLESTGPTATQATRPMPRQRGYTPTELAPRAGEIQVRTQDKRVEVLPAVVLDTQALVEPHVGEGSQESAPILLTRPKTTEIPAHEREISGEIIVLSEPKAVPRKRASTDVGVLPASESARSRRRIAGLENTERMLPPARQPDAETMRIPQQPAYETAAPAAPPRAVDIHTTKLARVSQSIPPRDMLPEELDASSEALVQVLRTLDKLETRNDILVAFSEYLKLSCERVGFFVLRDNALRIFPPRAALTALPTAAEAALSLDEPSTFKELLDGRLPYRGPLTDAASREFIGKVYGKPADIVIGAPVFVREKVVGVFYADGEVTPVIRQHLAVAARAAGSALERVLKNRKFGDSIPP